ncbi:NUDIX domain protein [uncultured archaeon]|nr:NUDIX domain protein [uncultured archaeon]
MKLAGEHAALIFTRSYGPYVRLYLTLHFAKKKERPWRFAGGKLEPGETPEQAAIREAKEELNVTVTKLRKVKEITTVADGGKWNGHWFLVEDFTGTIKILEPEKHDAAKYMTRSEVEYYCGSSSPEWEAVNAI